LKEDLAKPVALATKGPLVLNSNGVSRAPAEEKMSKEDVQSMYCYKFDQIEKNSIALTLKAIEETSYSVEEVLNTPLCQPANYSAAVKSPVSHVIADDPSKRVEFLDIFWLYYSKKRKDPAKFAEFVNAKNTEGETLLDYIETRMKEPIYARIMKENISKIISTACAHGAVYSFYADKKCP